MNTPVKMLFLFFAVLQLNAQVPAQVPSVQLKVKDNRAFLAWWAADCSDWTSNQLHQLPVTGDNVNSDQYYYFYVAPAEDWVLDRTLRKTNCQGKRLSERTNDCRSMEKRAENKRKRSSCSVFPKRWSSINCFSSRFRSAMQKNQAEFKVPKEYWPGFLRSLKTAILEIRCWRLFSTAAPSGHMKKFLQIRCRKFFRNIVKLKTVVQIVRRVKHRQPVCLWLDRCNTDLSLKDKVFKVTAFKPR